MGLSDEQITELIACRDLDTFCTKLNYQPLRIVFDLNKLMYPSRTDMLVFMLWSMIYNFDKTYAIVENSRQQCTLTMEEFYKLADTLPLWMQPVPSHRLSTSVSFTNGCKFLAVCNSIRLRGRTVSAVMISTDIIGKKAEELRDNIMPALVSGNPIIEFNNGQNMHGELNE